MFAAMRGLSALDSDAHRIQIKRDLSHSDASSIYEIQLYGERYAMKVVRHWFGAQFYVIKLSSHSTMTMVTKVSHQGAAI